MTDVGFMRRAATIAGNTTCWIGIGCVISKNGKILIETWNETLPGEEYCKEFRKHVASEGRTFPGKTRPYQTNEGCIRYEVGLSQGMEIEKACSIHAEALAISRAANRGVSINGATLFVTSFPCLVCLRAIIAAGIKKIVYMNEFYTPHHVEMIQKNKIEIEQISERAVWRREDC